MNPLENDALTGSVSIEIVPWGTTQIREASPRHRRLRKLPSIPFGLTAALLRLDPMFDPLRNDPRFQKLASPGSK